MSRETFLENVIYSTDDDSTFFRGFEQESAVIEQNFCITFVKCTFQLSNGLI